MKRFCEVGKLLRVSVLDHLIVSETSYLSLKDKVYF
ncbi:MULTISPECIES: JAB domain-containing protein [unclassified Sporosarcina]